MATPEKRLCWAPRVTRDDTAYGYVGRCPFRGTETENPGKEEAIKDVVVNILRIFSHGLIKRKVTCTLPEGSDFPKKCQQGKDYLCPPHHE